MFSDSYFRSIRPEVFCENVVDKNICKIHRKTIALECLLIKLQKHQHRWKESLIQLFSCEYCGISEYSIFIEQLWWLLLNFFTGSQNETVFSINRSVVKTFRCSFPIDFAFKMSIRYSERTTQPETIFFLAWIFL